MSLHHPTYEIETTLYLRSPRPAGGWYMLWEQDVTVTVSVEDDEGARAIHVEAIDFGKVELDGVSRLENLLRPQENCEISRPPRKPAAPLQGKEALEWVKRDMLWETLVDSLDMGHITEEVMRLEEEAR
jgi:hypothetical protein